MKRNIQKHSDDNWYRLDTSAKIYPAIESISDPAVFRVAVCLKKEVDGDILLQALEDIRERFPYFNVHLKKGLFWNYFQRNDNNLLIWPDTPSPCERIYRNANNGFLYKVKYYKNNIAVEFFHVLTDGFGAMEFLKSLTNRYLLLTGDIKENAEGVMTPDEKPEEEEYEDAFLKVLEENQDNPEREKKRTLFSKSKIYQIKDRLLPIGILKVTTGIVDAGQLKAIAKSKDCTITQLVAALYAEAMIHYQAKQEKNKHHHKNVAIEIPVNMRTYYPYRCMRNFSLFVIPQVDPREVNNLDDIIEAMKSFMKEHITHKHLLTMVEDNCSLAKNNFIKHVPVDIKNLVIGYINNTKGSTQFSGTVSNLGMINLPKEIEEHVEDVQILVGAKPQVKRSCSMAGYNGRIYITFARNVKDTYIEKFVFTRLVKMGVKVKLKSTT